MSSAVDGPHGGQSVVPPATYSLLLMTADAAPNRARGIGAPVVHVFVDGS